MPRRPKPPKSEAPLAPVASEILDQFARHGPISHEELDTAVRRFTGFDDKILALYALLWLALRNITAKWKRGDRAWKMAMRQFAIL
jgi:hypothetical protein